MTTFNRGAVVIARVRWSDGSGSKPRPAVIVCNDLFQAKSSDAIIVALTANVSRNATDDRLIADWQGAGLRSETEIKPVVATVKRTTIKKEIGNLSSDDAAKVDSFLRESMSL